jgi:3-oxoacyl-[acyl-carrier-protein] synthase I
VDDKPQAYVAGTGMITSIGCNAQMTAASVLAGISRYQYSDYRNKDLKPIKVAPVPDEALAPLNEALLTSGVAAHWQQLLRLADPALKECLSSRQFDQPIPLFLAVPETLPGLSAAVPAKFIKYLKLQTNAPLDPAQSRMFATGRAGGLHAIDLAFKYFEATGRDYVLIGGVDTYRYALKQLGTLDMYDRLAAEGVADGYAPGEAAGFLLLTSQKALAAQIQDRFLTLYQPGLGSEQGHWFSNDSYTGDGLSRAVEAALRANPGASIKTIYTSLNGERFGSKELGVALTRNTSSFSDDLKIEHPADCFGDIGAAFAPVLLGIMNRTVRTEALSYCSSDGEYRAAIRVSA